MNDYLKKTNTAFNNDDSLIRLNSVKIDNINKLKTAKAICNHNDLTYNKDFFDEETLTTLEKKTKIKNEDQALNNVLSQINVIIIFINNYLIGYTL